MLTRLHVALELGNEGRMTAHILGAYPEVCVCVCGGGVSLFQRNQDGRG